MVAGKIWSRGVSNPRVREIDFTQNPSKLTRENVKALGADLGWYNHEGTHDAECYETDTDHLMLHLAHHIPGAVTYYIEPETDEAATS